ncbi:MAG: hypothetical protein HYZ13_09205 [Acidobacteria bacterium]|nr:hypothetical protein [Acidobacteriota bacterium]
MTQRISILFGELITDAAIQRAVPLPPGVYEGLEPSLSGPGGSEGWTVTLATGLRGVSIWRTAGLPYLGSHTIYEDGPVTVRLDGPSAKPRIDLVVGAHRWVEGPMDAATGYPTGAFTADMLALYGVVKGTPDDDPVAPPLPVPFDATGRRATILAQVLVPASGMPTVGRWPATDLRMERRGLPLGNATLSEAGWLVEHQIPPVARPNVVRDTAGLRNLQPLQHTALAILRSVGIFQYDQTSEESESPTAVKPANAGGRWLLVLAAGSGGTDTQPPVLSALRIDGNVASATATDNVAVVRVEFRVDGTLKGTATSSPWQAVLDLSGLSGEHVLTASAFDAAGNAAASAPLTFTVGGSGGTDTQPPSVSVSVTGSSGTLTLAAQATDNIGVTRVEFLVDGALKGTLYTAPWTLPLDSTTLANGTHSLLAKAFDAADNVGSSPTVTFQVSNGTSDTTPPVITDLRSYPFTPPQAQQMVVAVDLQEAQMGQMELFYEQSGSRVAIGAMSPAGGTPQNQHYALAWAYPKILHGREVTFIAVATDAAGNTSERAATGTVDDAIPPTVAWTAAPPNWTLNPGESFRYEIRAQDAGGIGRVVWRRRNGAGLLLQEWTQLAPASGTALDGLWEMNLTAGPEGESFYVGAEAMDAQGARGYAGGDSQGLLIRVHDIVGPILSNLRVEDAPSPGSKVIKVDAVELEPSVVNRVTFLVDGGPMGVATAAPYQTLWASPTPGSHTIRAIAEDSWGNTSSAEIQVNLGTPDTAAPQVTWSAPPDGSLVSGPFQAQVHATDAVGVARVNWYVNGVFTASQAAPVLGTAQDGTWNLDLDGTGLLPGAMLTIEAVASDVAGNSGTASAMVRKPTADTTAPTITLALVSSNLTERTYRAAVSDDVGVVRVEWDVDGSPLGSTTQEPHEFSLDLGNYDLGSHALHAVAFDAAGNHLTATKAFFIRDDWEPGCFRAGTWILTPGVARPIESLSAGDAVLTIPDGAHEGDAPRLVAAQVEALHQHSGMYPLLDVLGIGATPEHAWATEEGPWTATESLVAGTRIRALNGSVLGWTTLEATPASAEPAEEVYNLSVRDARTYLVAAQPEGPFLLVHNIKIQTM